MLSNNNLRPANRLIVILSFIVSGCAANPSSNTVAATATDNEVICKREKPTGSNRPVKVCRPVGEALDREDTVRDMRVIQQQSEILNSPPPQG